MTSMTSTIPANLQDNPHGCLFFARLHERGRMAVRDLEKSLKLYEHALECARGDTVRRQALQGLTRLHDALGHPRSAGLYRQARDAMRKPKRHPKEKQLFINPAELMQLPYVRRHRGVYSPGGPGQFNPKRHLFANQKSIIAVVFHRREDRGPGPRGTHWETDVYWLKDYDGPDRWPAEAVKPRVVLDAVGVTWTIGPEVRT
ncbi:MAG: tetratricopeptide repeat protein [Methanomicrobiaceae archaeon]|nr:tetratricopeptide repeat protein [Methanomicrobiaceae archaeon]